MTLVNAAWWLAQSAKLNGTHKTSKAPLFKHSPFTLSRALVRVPLIAKRAPNLEKL